MALRSSAALCSFGAQGFELGLQLLALAADALGIQLGHDGLSRSGFVWVRVRPIGPAVNRVTCGQGSVVDEPVIGRASVGYD